MRTSQYAILFLAPFVLLSFVLYDRLVTYLKTWHVTDWQREGRPQGFFRLHPGGSYYARASASYRWLFRTPGWAHRSKQAAACLRALRVCVAVWCLGVAVVAVLFMTGHAR